MPYLTPNTAPSETICRTLVIPADINWIVIVNGAVSELIKKHNFEAFGTATPEETAAVFQDMFFAYLDSDCGDTMAETPIRLTADGKVEIWVVDMWMPDDAQRSHDPRELIPLQRPHADDANLQRESTGVAVSLLASLYVEQIAYMGTLDSGLLNTGSQNDKFADFILGQVSLLGVSPNPLAYICAAKIVDNFFGGVLLGLTPGADVDPTTVTALACELYPFVSPTDNYVTYEDWLTLKTNILIHIGNTFDSFGLWVERMLVLIGYKGLINLLSADAGMAGLLGDGAGDGTYGNTHFDNTACP